jgi:hypothetical protein
MFKKTRRKFTADQKAAVVRRHLVDKVVERWKNSGLTADNGWSVRGTLGRGAGEWNSRKRRATVAARPGVSVRVTASLEGCENTLETA